MSRGKCHCFTITIVGTLLPVTRENEVEEQKKIALLLGQVETSYRSIYPDAKYGRPPVTITVVELPE